MGVESRAEGYHGGLHFFDTIFRQSIKPAVVEEGYYIMLQESAEEFALNLIPIVDILVILAASEGRLRSLADLR